MSKIQRIKKIFIINYMYKYKCFSYVNINAIYAKKECKISIKSSKVYIQSNTH